MTKRCVQCQSANLEDALKCYECGHEFILQPRAPLPVIGAPDPEFDPPTVTSALPATRPVPAPSSAPGGEAAIAVLQAELQAEVERHRQEVAGAQALVTQLEQGAAERDEQIRSLKARVERQQNDLNARARAASAAPGGATAPGSQPQVSKALGAASKWPRVAMAVGAVMLVAAAGVGGWTLSHPRNVAPRSAPEPPAQVPVPAPPTHASGPSDDVPVEGSQGALQADANLREQKRLDDVKRALDKRDALIKTRESDAKTLDAALKQRDADLTARQAAFNTRDAALKAREAGAGAQSRAQPKVEAARMGYFDFRLVEVKNVPYFTVTKVEISGEGSSWPSKECAVVAVSPLDGNDRPASIPSTCTPEHIVINKMKGLKNGHTVRVIWQLK
jgi:hypothetical protein